MDRYQITLLKDYQKIFNDYFERLFYYGSTPKGIESVLKNMDASLQQIKKLLIKEKGEYEK